MQVEWKHYESKLEENQLCHTHQNLFQPIVGFHKLSYIFLNSRGGVAGVGVS